MIVITGAAGFIGSCFAAYLNEAQFKELVLVDDFSRPEKRVNYQKKVYRELVPRYEFFQWIKGKESDIEFIVHLGARTDTSEQDVNLFEALNVAYSKRIWQLCVRHQIPLIYASSAATYGGGEHGFSDVHAGIPKLKPLNPYGQSKQDFDLWALNQSEQPFFWAGIKFFNVYGPNEYHKGRMASVIYHAFNQIRHSGALKLFRSHHESYEDGKQLRDFIYVKDVVQVLFFLMQHRKVSGIYNLGTGRARTFLDLGRSVFSSLELEENISFIDTPEDIRATYQYFTEADMSKLRGIGFARPFHALEDGISDYVGNYLLSRRIY